MTRESARAQKDNVEGDSLGEEGGEEEERGEGWAKAQRLFSLVLSHVLYTIPSEWLHAHSGTHNTSPHMHGGRLPKGHL